MKRHTHSSTRPLLGLNSFGFYIEATPEEEVGLERDQQLAVTHSASVEHFSVTRFSAKVNKQKFCENATFKTNFCLTAQKRWEQSERLPSTWHNRAQSKKRSSQGTNPIWLRRSRILCRQNSFHFRPGVFAILLLPHSLSTSLKN